MDWKAPDEVVENDEVELYCDTERHDNGTQQTRYYPSREGTQKWTIIDIAVPSDFNVVRTEYLKVEES